MASDNRNPLGRFESAKDSYGDGAAGIKLELLAALERKRLVSANEVLRLHEALCFVHAYPDNAEVLARVREILANFGGRRDLRKFAKDLINSGVAGTPIDFRFYWYTASWLARRWPDKLTVDWSGFENKERLNRRLTLLMPYAESLALEEGRLGLRDWVRRLKRDDETDAAFLIRRFEKLRMDPPLRELYYEELDIPYRLAPGPDTPARTTARYAPAPVAFQKGPLDGSRSTFRPALEQPPRAVRSVPPAEARVLIDLAREAMVTRDRDLDVFVHADALDVKLIDCGDGLQFACYGSVPRQRQMLDAVYGFLMLKNGVPIGYVLCSALYESAEIAFNLFEAYRGGEAANLFGHSVSVVRHVFDADTFLLDPYQLGYGNREGLESGAWWFYYKLGFRPKDAETKKLVRTELRKLKANRRYRSSIATLEELAAADMYLHLGRERSDVIGIFTRENVGLHIVRDLSERFGADRERGLRICSREAARTLGVRSQSSWSAGERLAWERWSPLVRILPGIDGWSRPDKTALVRVIRAKGGPRESEFVSLFDKHRPLRRALLKLSASDPYP